MIGVAKNHSVSRLASRSRMSRKCTVSADSDEREAEREDQLDATITRKPEQIGRRHGQRW